MAITNDFDLTRKKDEKKDEKKTSFNDRLNALLEKATDEPANKRSREAVAQLQETGRTTYRGKEYTLPETTPAQAPTQSSGLVLPTARRTEPTVTGEDVDQAYEDTRQARRAAREAELRLGDTLPDYYNGLPTASEYEAQQLRIRAAEQEAASARRASDAATQRYESLAGEYQKAETRRAQLAAQSNPDFTALSMGDEETALKNVGKPYYQIFHRKDTTAPGAAQQEIPGKTALGSLLLSDVEYQNQKLPSTGNPYAFMNDDEAATYFYYWNTPDKGNGPKAASAYLEQIMPELNARAAAYNQLAEAEYAKQHPVLASGMSVPANLAGGVTGMIDLTVQNIGAAAGNRRPIDYNTPAQMAGKTAQNYRSAVGEMLAEKYPASGLGGTLNWASFAYQTGMSMVDSGIQAMAAGGFAKGSLARKLIEGIGLALLGGSAAQQSVYAAKERGASDGQALLSGYAAGIAEAAFEKISLDNLVDNIVAKNGMSIGDKLTKNWVSGILGKLRGAASWAINTGIQGAVEGSEEVATTLANTLTDVSINRAHSELLSKVEEYQRQGLSPDAALKTALKEWGYGLIQDALGGFFSGGIMGGAGTGAHLLSTGVSNVAQATKTAWEQSKVQPQEETKAPAVEETPALEMPLPERQREPLSYALDKINNGGTVSNSDAKAIMDNPQAVQALRDSGVLTNEGTSASEQRNAVKTAVQAYAEQQAAQEASRAAQEERRPQEASTTAEEEVPRGEAQARQQEAPRTESPSGLKMPVNEPLTQNRNENKITLTNNQEVTNNGQGQQAETADQRFIRLAAEQRGTVPDGSERGTRLGRFVENYRAQREYQNQERAGALLRSQAAARNLTWTSAEELGVANGSDEQTVRLLDNPALNRTQRQTISDYAAKGVNLQFVQGMMALNERTASGKQVMARAYISKDGKHIIVQADHPYLTWKQLLDHEEFHRQIKLDKNYKERVEKAMLADSRIAPYLSDIIDRYTAAYKEMNPGITAEEILEEMLADYRAGFDMLSSSERTAGNRAVTKAAAETIRKVESKQASKAVQAAERTGATVVPAKTAEQSTADITDAMADGDVSAAENFSYEALGAAGGFTAVEKDGNRYFIDQNGKRITEVTPKQVMESPIGTLLNYAAEQGWLGKNKKENQAALKQQAQFFADILTLASKNQDFAMSMNMAGAVAFTAIKANSDHQYKTTYDFKSICIKTQAIINNMSAAMVAKKGALTKDEILDIYRATARDGLPVPCPECYVFSRWIGIGGLLDNIWKYQQRYGKMTPQQVVDAYDAMADKVRQAAEASGLTFGKAKSSIAQKVTKQYNDLREKIEKADNQGEYVKDSDRETLKSLEGMMTDVKALTWIKDVYFGGKAVNAANRSEGYEVPADVLFDLNKGGEFATKYANAWAFRTTQGAGYGKAITPYAEAVLGEGILGTANLSNTLKGKAAGTLKNPFLDTRGEISKDVRAKLEKAVANEKTQLFRGGQRFSSTSDMSNDVVSDLLIAMLEMQTMHAGVQMYTKVDGAVGPLTLMGAFVNQSLMPLGTGFKNGELADTSVGGMNPKVAFANREKYARAGTITIGVNDNHIRALIKQVVRDFVIPYHASGGDANLVGEMRTVNDPGEASTKSRSTDYTRTQGDKIMTDNLLRSLGKTEEEIERIHQNRQARIAILTRGNPNMDVVRANPLLSELYDRFNGGEWDGVKLPKSEIEHFIYPNEFWDITVDYEHSGRNTQLYLDYCEALGFLHRFSGQIQQAAGNTTVLKATTGYDENGKRVPLTDLAYVYENGEKTDKIEDFFWKLLVDRRMYDNDGKYLPQGAISLSSIATGDIIDFAKNNVGRQYNEAQSQALADRIREVYDQYSDDPEAIAREVLKLINESKQQESGEEGSYSREYSEAIDMLDRGELPRDTDTHIQVLDHTPNVYIDKAGAKDRRMVISWESAYLAMKKNGTQPGNYHNLGPDLMKQIPGKLADPEYVVIRPDGRINAILEMRKKNRPILVSVEMDAYEHTTQEGKDDNDIYNLIVTVMDASHNYLQNNVFENSRIVENKNNEDPAHFISRLKLSQNATMSGNALAESSENDYTTSEEKVKGEGKTSIETDSAYLRAVESGDMETAQRMVDEAAKKAGYRVERYHGTKANFNKFNPDFARHGGSGFGYYFGDKALADEFGEGGRVIRVLLNDKAIGTLKTHNITADGFEDALKQLGLSPEKTYMYMGAESAEEYVKAHHDYRLATDLQYWAINPDRFAENADGKEKTPREIISILKNTLGLDGIERGREVVLWDNTLMKLADPVTYDDNGNVIPLSERFNQENEDIRYSVEPNAPYNRTALVTEETVDRWLKDYASKGSPKYAQAYITRMTPKQFLDLTTSTMGRLAVNRETEELDTDKLIKATQQNPLQLIISDGEVVGHEGRHRMNALQRAGVSSIPVLVFDSSNKYSKTDVPEMVLQGQDFGSSRSYDKVTLENLIPLSYENRDRIVQDYRKQDAFERSADKLGYRQTMKFSIETDSAYLHAVESGDMGTAQRMVDEAAEKAMPKSEVREQNGKLLRVYHGTKAKFNKFDRAFIGSTGRFEGAGFNFTPYEGRAKSYGGNVLSGYLDIQHPLSAERKTISAGALAKIIREADPSGDNIIANYAQNTNDYGTPAFVAREARVTARAIWGFADNDVDIYSELSSADPDSDSLIKAFQDLGYDGLIHYDDSGKIKTAVAFNAEQFKLADPVTYDDEGNPIPLSERFNPNEEEFRYSIETDPDVAARFQPEAVALREGRSGRRAGGKKKVSKVRSNTYDASGLFNEVEAQMEEAAPENYTYDPISEKKSMNEARGRIRKDFDGEVSKLSQPDYDWGGSDLDTAMGILHQYRTEGRMTGDYTDFWNWSKVIQEKGTKGGQFIQAFAKYTRTGTGTAQKAAEDLRKQYQLNPAQEAKVKKAAKDILDGIDGDAEGAARDAVETAKGNKAPRDNAPALPKNVPDNSKELRAAQRRITSLQNKVTKLRQELSDLKKEYRQLDKENDRLRKRAQELKARMDAKQEELRQTQKELTKARRRIDRLEKQKENLKNQLDFEKQRRKDAERLLREVSQMFEQMQQAEEAAKHGTPVKNWIPLTGEELAKRISARVEDPKAKTQTAMQTILSDLVKFAEEHALPERKTAERQKRTAIDRITDYLNNRDAYGAAWGQTQSILRAQYADDIEKLSALEDFLGATISYNAEGTDRTMLDAILESADVLGISEKRILELASTGVTESTISRIGDELADQVKGRMGSDYDDAYTQPLKDAVRRHVNGIILAESMADQQLRLTRLTTDAARKLDTDLNRILTESRRTKTDAAQRIANYLITELGVPSGDAAIAAQNIAGAFMDELAARADKRLQRMFADKTPKTREQRDKLLDLLRLGGFTNANVEDAVADALGIRGLSREEQKRITADMARFGETLDAMLDDDLDGLRNLIREQAAVRQTPLSPQAERVLEGTTDAEYLRDFALAQLASIAGDYAPRNEGARISTVQTISHLLNMRTALRNLTSNQVFDLVDSAANNLSMIPDMVIGAFTGKRTVGPDRSWTSRMKRQGAIEGAGRNLLEVRLDVSPNERQKSKYGTAGRRTNSMANSNAFRRILSHLEEVMGYELNTTDEFHKGSVRGETLESLARWVEQGYMTQEEANAFAEQEALYRSFQDDTLVGNFMAELKQLANMIGFGNSGKTNSRGRPIHDFGLGDLVVKYTQVPGALIHRGIEYSPLGYAKMLYDLALSRDSLLRTQHRGENTNAAQRRVAMDIGRATTGSGLITLFALLAKAGLLRRDDDDKDKNAKAMHAAQGLSGTQLNVTGLGRMIEGGDATPQDGDVLADIGFLEPLDSLMTIATLLAKEEEIDAATVGVKNLDGIWKAISNTSAMQTISNIISTVQYHDNKNDLPLYFQIPIEIASDSVSGFIPSPVRQMAQATDTTYRDQYRSKNISDQVRAKVMNSIPGVRKLLAPKITPLGEDKKYQAPVLNYFNATLNPGNINVYQSSRVVDELDRVYAETEDEKIWPERNAPYTSTISKQSITLTPDERTQFQRTRGQLTAKMMEATMNADWYRQMDAESKADVLNWIGLFANAAAKIELAEGRGIDYAGGDYAKAYNAMQSGTPLADVVAAAKSKAVAAAEETAAATATIAAANIPQASKTEAETMSAEAKQLYAGFLKGGVSDDTAKKLATDKTVSGSSGHEQWRAIYKSAGSEGEKAVTSVMTEDMQRNWKLAKNAGVSMDDYIKVREAYMDLDEDGRKEQKEWNATLDSMTFSTNAAKDKTIKGTLWQILTGSSSTKNNPYDKDAGQKVIDAKGGGSTGGKNSMETFSRTLKLPTIEGTAAQTRSRLRLPTE